MSIKIEPANFRFVAQCLDQLSQHICVCYNFHRTKRGSTVTVMKPGRPEEKFKALVSFRLYSFMKALIKIRNCPAHCSQLRTYKLIYHCNIICLVYTERREIKAGTGRAVFVSKSSTCTTNTRIRMF